MQEGGERGNQRALRFDLFSGDRFVPSSWSAVFRLYACLYAPGQDSGSNRSQWVLFKTQEPLAKSGAIPYPADGARREQALKLQTGGKARPIDDWFRRLVTGLATGEI